MKLSRFITAHIERIIFEWESFARTLRPAANEMSTVALRDHARQILQAMALDIETDENAKQRDEKSKGLALADVEVKSAAATHGTLRQVSGFSLLQLTAEYRALRATVLRLWMPQISHVTEASTNDMLRFNEAIDQAMAESVSTYSKAASRTRDTFLSILGHDLRTPLATMKTAGDYLTRLDAGTDRTLQVGVRVKRSAATMTSMANDLLEYARTQMGGEIMTIAPSPADMRKVCQSALDEARSAHPDCTFELHASGALDGYFDAGRMQQAILNLLNNAAQNQTKEHPVTIRAQGEPDAVTVQVTNFGPVLPAESLQAIFSPLDQLSVEGGAKGRLSTSVDLGLFIAREITVAHGGTISAESSEKSGTVFTIRLPRGKPL